VNSARPERPERKDDTVVALPQANAPAQAAPRGHSAFVPLLLGGLALLLMLGWQTVLLAGERSALQAGHASQQQTVDNAGTLRAQLDALAADTQRLADVGNPNAALLVTELKKRGITINPAAAAATAAAASATGK
jgi:hypothetical protein